MATTSSTLTAGATSTGRGGNSTNITGRTAGVLATAALGLSLLTGLAFAQARTTTQFATSVSPPAAACIYASAAGLPGEGCSTPSAYVADQFSYREERRVETRDIFAVAGAPSCVAASTAGVPGEGCGADLRALPAAADTAIKYWQLLGIWV